MTTYDPMPTFVYPLNDKVKSQISDLIANDELILCLEDFVCLRDELAEPRSHVLHKASNKWLEDVTFSRRFTEGIQREPLKLVCFIGSRTFVMLRHRVTKQEPSNSCTVDITAYTCQLSEPSNVIHVMRSARILELKDPQYQKRYVLDTVYDRGADASFYMLLFWDRATHLYKVNAEHSEAQELTRIDNERYRRALALQEKVLLLALSPDGFEEFCFRTYDPSLESVSERFCVPMPRDTRNVIRCYVFEGNLIVFYRTIVEVINMQTPDVRTPILDLYLKWAIDGSWKPFVLASGEITIAVYRDAKPGERHNHQLRVGEVCVWNLLAPPRLAELALRATHRHMPSATAQNLHPSRVRNVSLLIDFLLTPTTSAPHVS